MYYVYGKVILSPQKSKYRFSVTKIYPNQFANQSKKPWDIGPDLQTTIAQLERDLQTAIEGQLETVQVHGKISSIIPRGRFTLLHLKDSNFNKDREMIECAIPRGIVPRIALNPGKAICVRGEIKIFQNASVYQIMIANAADIMPGPSLKHCKCRGCKSCQPPGAKCNQTRNPRYELCSACYAIGPDHEKRVEKEVKDYFSNLKVEGFSAKTQQGIQIGSKNCIADVVLTNENGNFASIAECKGAGFVGDGKEQLYSYLSATDTRFGVFANRVDPNDWKFYENRRRNQFEPITRDQFEDGVVKGITLRKQLKDEIESLESNHNQLRAEIKEKIQQFEILLNDNDLKSDL